MTRKVCHCCVYLCVFPFTSELTTYVLTTFFSPDFFDQFEQQTQGENFVRDDNEDATQERGKSGSTNEKASDQQDNDKDDINHFFDEFEKTTRGENFKRE